MPAARYASYVRDLSPGSRAKSFGDQQGARGTTIQASRCASNAHVEPGVAAQVASAINDVLQTQQDEGGSAAPVGAKALPQ